ncbi:serine protease [Lacibacterium aquatile]|uniref:Serine protease n=1 Tax=Lacibacterium aquatile TaxID=1168082 RepID=A0ABW5DUN1_9PROT
MPKTLIEQYSVSVSPLEMFFGEIFLSKGTAFFWISSGQTYLVTNWHNVTGVNPITGDNISSTGGRPNKIKFDLFIKGDLNRQITATMDLFVDDVPSWLEHPIYGRKVDVVCLQLNIPKTTEVFPINSLKKEDLQLRVGADVFVIGYPLGLGKLPIWKRASIATEPQLNVDDKPLIYVDTATSSGMSGSPVIRRSEMGVLENGDTLLGGGPSFRFIGVYSGRLVSPAGSLEAQLGFVWKAQVIDEIINGQARGAMP